MNVVFVIFNLRVGKGGHSFSLNATATMLSPELNNVKILDISNKNSYVLSSANNISYERLSYNNPITLLKKLKVKIDGEFDVIHCFDDFSYILVRMAFFSQELPVILTKCGGGNPRYYYPHSDYLVCYSKENYTFFEHDSNFENVVLLPNRLLIQEKTLQTEKLEYLEKSKFNMLCVSRINDYYETKIRQSINLLQLLVENGVSASLTIIGTIEDCYLFGKFEKLGCKLCITFLTEDVFTRKASSYIHFFDCVIGTGRGFMEGAAASKLMFVPTTGANYPTLVNENNIDYYSQVNFSQRGDGGHGADKLILRLVELIEGGNERCSYDLFMKKYSQTHFLINSVKGDYLNLYGRVSLNKNKFKLLNFMFGFLYFFYRVFSFKYKIKNPFFKN